MPEAVRGLEGLTAGYDHAAVIRDVRSHGRIVLESDAEHLRANKQLLIASYLGERAQDAAGEGGGP